MGEIRLHTESWSERGTVAFRGRQSQLALEAYRSQQFETSPPPGERIVIVPVRTRRYPDIYVPDKAIAHVFEGLYSVTEKMNDDNEEGREFYTTLACQLRFNPVMIGLFQQATKQMIEGMVETTRRGFLEIVSKDDGEYLPHATEALAKQVNQYRNNLSIRGQG